MKRILIKRNLLVLLVLCFQLTACDIPNASFNFSSFKGCFTEEKDFTIPAAKIVTLNATTTNGDIVASSTDASDIKIHVVKTVQAQTQEEADEKGPKVNLHADPEGDTLKVYYEYPKEWKIRVDVDYTITCPPAIAQKLKTTNGNILVKGIKKSVDGRTTNGSIYLEDGLGAINLGTTNGNLSALNTSITENSKFSTTNGNVDIKAIVATASLQLNSTNGFLTLSLPSAFSGQLDAKTTNGRVKSDLAVTAAENTSKSRLKGVLGAGGNALIQARTTNGAISIQKVD